MLKMESIKKEKRDHTGGGRRGKESDSEQYLDCDPVKPKMKTTSKFASHRGSGW